MQHVFTSWSSSSSVSAFRLLLFAAGFSTYFFKAVLLLVALSLMTVVPVGYKNKKRGFSNVKLKKSVNKVGTNLKNR